LGAGGARRHPLARSWPDGCRDNGPVAEILIKMSPASNGLPARFGSPSSGFAGGDSPLASWPVLQTFHPGCAAPARDRSDAPACRIKILFFRIVMNF